MSHATQSHQGMQAVIADAYRIFGSYPPPTAPLDVCTACCIDPQDELALRETPLRKITAAQFRDYNFGAALGPIQPAAELCYFIPRMLELLADGEHIDHSAAHFLARLGRVAPDALSAAERDVLQRFVEALFAVVLRGQLVHFSALDMLVMTHIAGLEVRPLLSNWLHCEAPWSTYLYIVESLPWFWHTRAFSNAFADDKPELCEMVKRWMLDPTHRAAFATKIEHADFVRYLARMRDEGDKTVHGEAETLLGLLRSD